MSTRTYIDDDGVIHEVWVKPPPPPKWKRLWDRFTGFIELFWDSGAWITLLINLLFVGMVWFLFSRPETQALMKMPISEVPLGTVIFIVILMVIILRQ